MTETYSTYEAKAKLSEILRKVERGQTILISRHGEPIAEVRPIATAQGSIGERIAELVARGIVVERRGPAMVFDPVASRSGALKQFLEERE